MPGHKLEVLAICTDPNEGFWVASSPNFLFRFSNDGELMQSYKVDGHYLYFRFAINAQAQAILFMDDAQPNYIASFDLAQNTFERLFEVETTSRFKNAMYRMNSGGGILLDEKQNIYFANTIENKIFKFNAKGILVGVFKSENKNFKLLDVDFPAGKAELMQWLGSKPNFSSVLSIHLINTKSIVALYVIDNRPNIEIFSVLDGKVANAERIVLPLHMAYANENLIYLVYHPEKLDGSMKDSNPLILRYRLKQAHR